MHAKTWQYGSQSLCMALPGPWKCISASTATGQGPSTASSLCGECLTTGTPAWKVDRLVELVEKLRQTGRVFAASLNDVSAVQI